MSLRRALAGLGLVFVAVAFVPPAAGQATVRDYDPTNAEWNGGSQLVELARTVGLEVTTTDVVDWKDLDPDEDLLVVLYPTTEVSGREILAWVGAGGRVLLADDFGRCDVAFAELGLTRAPARGVHPARWHEDNPQVPVASSWADAHPLARDVDELVTNHPAIFRGDAGEVVFGFGRGEAVVVAGSIGDGRWVALSDPSVVINGMLAFDGNLTFAANLLDWLRPVDAGVSGGRLVFLTQTFVLTGQPPEPAVSELGLPGVARALRDLGRELRDLDQWIPDDGALRAIAVLAAFALILVGAALLPLARAQKLDGAWTKAHAGHERADFEKLVEGFDDPKWEGSFAWPATLLRDAIEARLGQVTGVAEPLTLPTTELLRRVEAAAGRRAATALAAEVERLRALPTREQAAAMYGRIIGRRDFERMYDAAQTLLKALG